MSSIEGIEQIGATVSEITIAGPRNSGPLPEKVNPSIAAAVNDARRDVPPPEPLSPEEIAQRTMNAVEAASAADPLFGKTVVEEDGVMVVKEPEVTIGEFSPGTTVAAALQEAVAQEFGTGEEPELFDGSAYVAVPEIDGQAADKLVIAFSGSIAYDASDDDGRRLFDKLTLGHPVELRVAGVVAGKTGTYKVTARDEEVVTGKATVKVDTVYVLTPEAL